VGFHNKLGYLELDPFKLCPVTPGSLGINDAASPDKDADLFGSTPGPLGWCHDHASPEAYDSILGVGRLHLTLSWDRDLGLWDYDPHSLLDDPNLSPDFVSAAHNALKAALQLGLRPRVHEAYRTPEESARKHKLWKQKKGGRAADAWRSCHNYGLAMDVWLYDQKQNYIDNHVKGWYAQYKRLAEAAKTEQFFWGEAFGDGDSDHFEFHPNWRQGADGAFLLEVKQWAEQAAISQPGAGALPGGKVGPPPGPKASDWIPFFWWAAGAGGSPPPKGFLMSKSQPGQKA
jgi:hypothetical protein